MNKGIKKATGEWLFFLGSDDSFYNNDTLAEVAELIKANNSAQIVYGDVQLNKPIGNNSSELVYGGEFNGSKLLGKNICHQSIFYNRSLFHRFGLFRTKYRIFADYDFNLRCFNTVSSYYTKKIVANFNVNGQSNTHQNLDKLFQQNFLENMAVYYPYSYTHPFFNGRKKELFHLLLKSLRSLKIREPLKLGRILAYQSLKRKD